jgi:AcrR family transcriptional regulator
MDANAGASPQQQKRQRTKNQNQRRLLDEGLKLMAQYGVFECKVEHITKAAGVAKGTFFNYFGSKEGFVLALLDYVLGDLARRVRPVGLSPTDAESLVAGVGAVHLRYFQLRPQAAAVLNQAAALASHPQVGQGIKERLSGHLRLMAGMLEPACGPLDWPVERVAELALMILSNSIGFFWIGQAVDLGEDTPMKLLDRLAKVQARGLAVN